MNQIHDPQVSDSGLRAFDATARFGSFTAAAAHLGVGQPAVSHAVARLEQVIGSRLFERSSAGVRLTAIGRTLHERVGAGFDQIDLAVATAVGADAAVTISVSASLATHWLLPRLPEFKRLHPNVALRVITTDSDRGVGRDDADLWIPLGIVESDELVATEFCAEEVLPVASPSMAERLPFGDPSALLDAPLLHLEERYAPRFDWRRWFHAQGVRAPTSFAGYRSNDYSLIVQGALDGQGLALGWMHIVEALIRSGRLVALAAPLRTDRSFPILQRRDRTLSPAADTLRDWLASIGYRPM
jgi:DNA-binding transcriptional LysR family regulator